MFHLKTWETCQKVMFFFNTIYYFFKVMHSESQPGRQYIIDIDVANGGIPYADSFYVNVHFYLSR